MDLPKCRLFLVAPSAGDEKAAVACLDAAVGAGDVASLLLRPVVPGVAGRMIETLVERAQHHGVAAIIENDTRIAARLKADGVEVTTDRPAEDIALARNALPHGAIVGAHAGESRHAAMERAEAGADYVVLSGREADGDPRAGWWSDVAMVPAIADGFAPADLPELSRRSVEFVRLAGDWSSPEAMAHAVAAFAAAKAS
jgi:thiamine-phosphate pyrophosphorylase